MDEKFKDALRKIGFSDQEVTEAEARERNTPRYSVLPRNKIDRAVIIYKARNPAPGVSFAEAFQQAFREAMANMGFLTAAEIDYIVGPQQTKEEE